MNFNINTFKFNLKRKTGFSLMEMILVITITLILVTAVLVTFKIVSERNKVTQAAKELALIKKGIDDLMLENVVAVNNNILLNSS
ncbi:TPA: prepilin-type N-terminal cleavage/methylation domain-containing protein [Escherichia coli]|nr:prepilin-type N-terminal cleavage/methylation domain-containing protein [Escherichia coli]